MLPGHELFDDAKLHTIRAAAADDVPLVTRRFGRADTDAVEVMVEIVFRNPAILVQIAQML